MSLLKELQRYTGSILALIACLAFTLMDASAQSCMRHGLGPAQVALYRMIITIPIISACIYIRNPSYFSQLDPRSRSEESHQSMMEVGHSYALLERNPESIHNLAGIKDGQTLLARNPALAARLIWLRSTLRSTGLCLAFASMARIAISEFATVFSPSSFLIGFLCWVVLREPFGWRLRIAAVGSQDTASRTTGFLLCFVCLLIDGLDMFVLRYLGPGPDPLTVIFSYGIACLVVCPMFMLLFKEPIGAITEAIVYAKLIVLAMSLVMAMQRETGATVSVILYAQIPMSVVVQSLLLEEMPNLLQIIGGAIILSSSIWAIVAESHEQDVSTAKAADGGYSALAAERDGNDEELERVAPI